MKQIFLALLLSAAALSLNAQHKTISLSAMDLSLSYQSIATVQKDKSVTEEPFLVAGQPFQKGIGVHADNKMKFGLHRNTKQFSCKVGVNDHPSKLTNQPNQTKIPLTDGTMIFYQTDPSTQKKQFQGIGKGDGTLAKGSVIFRAIADGKELFNSGVMRGGDQPKQVTLDLTRVELFELITENAGDGNSGDHANWLDALFTYTEITPAMVNPDYSGAVEPMNPQTAKRLQQKIASLPTIQMPLPQTATDWLLDNKSAKAFIAQTDQGKELVLSNGLVSRIFRIYPNLATIDIVNQMTNQNMLRAVSNEGVLKIDDKIYPLGGLEGQQEYGYTQYDWIDQMRVIPNAFRITDFEVTDLKPHINWANKRWSLVKLSELSGKVITFHLEGPGHLKGVKVKLHYALYDGIPCISKWFEVENRSGMSVTIDEFTLEQLAMAEPESPVEATDPAKFLKPNIHVESDWGFLGFTEKEAERTEFWQVDKRYTSQCNYPMVTPCLLEVKLPIGPDEELAHGETFQSFRTWLMPFDSDDRDRKGLFLKRMYKKIAPWTTENPIFLHCTSTDWQVVKTAIDQCAETGYEMLILSFGSGLNMEDESDENRKKFNEYTQYARSKGIELGGYSLLSSRWISDEVDVINPETGKRGGMIFGSSPCLSSEWGYDYFRKIKSFFEKTGMTVFENDGSYPGNVCASTTHAHHKGLHDSQWKQRKQIAALYQWMCENGIYTNVPDFGYILNGSTKVGIGYREVNWSLPRERQLVLGRQVLYDGLWERLPGMCWTFVPLTQYHGGGAAATLEPLSEHLSDYKAHMMQNYGSGVQACYRGHRLYDTEATKQTVKEVITWYKKYRDILNSEIVHIRRPDGKEYDGIMHINPELKQKGFVMLYNPTSQTMKRDIPLSLYYTGLTNKATIREQEGASKVYTLDRDYRVKVSVSIPAKSYTWLVVE